MPAASKAMRFMGVGVDLGCQADLSSGDFALDGPPAREHAGNARRGGLRAPGGSIWNRNARRIKQSLNGAQLFVKPRQAMLQPGARPALGPEQQTRRDFARGSVA